MGKKSKKDKRRVLIPAEIERAVMVEASFRCSVERCASTSSLQIHHIDYDPSNNDPANLLVLCSNCHGRATRKEIDRKACLMMKDLLRMQKSSKAELEEVMDEKIAEMRKLFDTHAEAKPLEEKDRGTQRPNGRIGAAASQVMILDKANVPLPIDVLRSLEESLYWSSELHAALEIQRIVMKSGTPTATDHFNLGVLLHETARKEEAEEAYREALNVDPEDADVWSNLGVLLDETGRKGDAEEAYRTATNIDPRHDNAWCNLGVVLDETGRKEEAEQAYRTAIHLDPNDAIAWNDLGVLMKQAGRKEEAEEAYRKALHADPGYAKAWLNLGSLLIATGRKDEAAEASQKAMEARAHGADKHNCLAYLLWECGRFEDAELEVREALKDNPDYAYAHATLGLLRLEQNDLGEGRQGYEKAIELAPDDLPLLQKYHYEYGRALARNGEPEEARTEFETGLKVETDYVREQIEAELAKLG